MKVVKYVVFTFLPQNMVFKNYEMMFATLEIESQTEKLLRGKDGD